MSLQDSRRERGLDGGIEERAELDQVLDRGQDRIPGPAGDLGEVALHSLIPDAPQGARGAATSSCFPASSLEPPRPPNRTDSKPQALTSNPYPLPPPPPSLSAELLELGDSLMKLGNITTPYSQEQLCSHHAYSHSTLSAAYTGPSHRQDQSSVLDHITITNPHYDGTEQSYCCSTANLAGEHTATCAPDHTHNPTPPCTYNQEQAAKYDGSQKPEGSYNPRPEHTSSHAPERPNVLEHLPKVAHQPPAQLCLPSPELEPELLLSPVIPPGRPFTPSDPQSLEALDPTASAQLLDNIMAWFNNNINPQNNPQSLALIPSPSTTETESSPDTHTETESQASRGVTPAQLWPPLEGEPQVDAECESPRLGAAGEEVATTPRPCTLELVDRESVRESVDLACVAGLSLDEVHTHPGSCSQELNSPTDTAPASETNVDLVLHLNVDQSPEEWEEQVHLV